MAGPTTHITHITLRGKTLLLISFMLAVMIVLLYVFSQFMLLSSFEDLEQEQVTRNINRVLNTFDGQLATLRVSALAFAADQAVTDFLQNGNGEAFQHTLTDQALVARNLNLVLLVNGTGRIVYGRTYDHTQGRGLTLLPELVDAYLAASDLALDSQELDSYTDGIVTLTGTVMLVAIQPVLLLNDPADTDASLGRVVVGRTLDRSLLDQLAATMYLQLDIHRIDDPDLPENFRTARARLLAGATYFIMPLDKDTIAGHVLVRDINDQPALVLCIELPRLIHQEGRTTIAYFLGTVGIVGVLMAVLMLALLEWQVVRRVVKLSDAVRQVRKEGVTAARMPVHGHDELARLADGINNMLDSVRASQAELTAAHADLERRAAEREQLLQQVQVRAKELATVAELSRRTTTLLDLNELLPTVVSLVQQNFDLYHVHIYLFNPTTESLILAAAAKGEVWQRIVAEGVAIPLHFKGSAIARAAQTRERVVIEDVRDARDFLPNPLLPNTRSSLALPMIVGDDLIGVLAIEDSKTNRFTADVIAVQVTLAGQVAIAIHNAQVFTANQRVTEALSRSEERLELALRGAELGLWDWNIPTGEVIFNHRWAEMLGYTLDEIEPHVRTWEQLAHPGDLAEVMPILNAHLRGETPFYESEHRMRTKLGGWVWVLDRGKVVVRDDSGQPLRVTGTHLDITGRKQAEAAIHRANRAYHTLSECNQAMVRATSEADLLEAVCEILVKVGSYKMAWIGFVDADDPARVRVISQAGEDSAGYLAERSVYYNLPPGTMPTSPSIEDGQPFVVRDIAESTDNIPWAESALKRGYHGSTTLPLLDGKTPLGTLSVYTGDPAAFDERELALLAELAADLVFGVMALRIRAERARAEVKLRQSEERLELALRGAELGLWDWNIPTGDIVFNPRWAEMLGYTLDEIELGVDTWERLLHPDDLPKAWDVLNTHLAGTIPFYETEYRMRSKSGEWVWVLTRGKVVARDADDQPVRITGTHLDITGRKQAEAVIQRANRAYHTLSECNQAMVRATSEADLLEAVCEILVKVGSYKMAWIGFVDADDPARVRVISQSGEDSTGYLAERAVFYNLPSGTMPISQAIANRQPYVMRDMAQESHGAAWADDALRRGYRAAVTLPLINGDTPLGTLSVYAADPGAFDDQELALLTELATDIVFGITTLRIRADRIRAEAELRQNKADLSALIENTQDLIWSVDREMRLVTANTALQQSLLAAFGYAPQIGELSLNRLPPDEATWWETCYRHAMGGERLVMERRYDPPTVPTPRDVEIAFNPIRDETSEVVGVAVFSRDITRSKQNEADLRRLIAAEREQRVFSDALSDTAAAINSTLDLDDVLNRFLENVAQVVPSPASNIMLIEENQARVVGQRGYERFGVADWITGLSLLLDQFPTWDSWTDGTMPPHGYIMIPDVHTYPHWTWFPENTWIRSHLKVPIHLEGEMLGILNLDSDQLDAFSVPQARRLQALANQAANAIRNARLFRAESEQRALSDAMRDTAAAISQSLDTDVVLLRVLEHVGRVIPHDSANIMQIEPEAGIARLIASHGYEAFDATDWIADLVLPIDDPSYYIYDVLSSGKPVIIADTHADPRWHQHAEGHWIGSYAAVPIMLKGQVIGLLNLDSATRGFFKEEHAARLQMFADQVSAAIHNAQLFSSERDQRALAEALRDTAAAINSTLDLTIVMEAIFANVGRVAPHDAATIMFLDENNTTYVVGSSGFEKYGLQDWIKTVHLSTQDAPDLLEIMRTGQPNIIPDTHDDPGWIFMPEAAWIRSHITVPIGREKAVIGFLMIDSETPGQYSKAQIKPLSALADQIGIAMRNAQLFEAERDQRTLAEALRDTAAAISSTLDHDAVLDRILANVKQVLPHDAANIMLIQNGVARVVRGHGYAERGLETWINELRFVVSEVPIWQRMIQRHEAFAVPDTHQDPQWIAMGKPEEAWIRSTVKAPIHLDGQLVGILHVDSQEPGTFGPKDAERLQAFADQAAIALRNARLYEAIQRQMVVLEKMVDDRTVELNQERARLVAILDSMGEGVLHVLQREIVYANRAISELFGYPEEVIRSFKPTTLPVMSPDVNYEALLHDIRTTLSRERYWSGDTVIRRQDGKDVPVALTVTLVRGSDSDQPLGAVVIVRDIRKEKELNEQRVRFIGQASHELRTPLTNIKTRLYLLRNQPEELERHLEVMEHVTDSMTELVTSLLAVSRFERGKIELRCRRVMLQTLIEDVVKIQRPEAEKKQIALNTVLANTPLPAFVDPQRMAQVITNLVINAIHYTPDDGQITVELDRIEEQGTVWAVMRVRDTGIGMDAETAAQVFDPFFRAAPTASPGTGLGLTITREIVFLHGGQIRVESVPGEGSTFIVTLRAG